MGPWFGLDGLTGGLNSIGTILLRGQAKLTGELQQIQQAIGRMGDHQSQGNQILTFVQVRGDIHGFHLGIDLAARRHRLDNLAIDIQRPLRTGKTIHNHVHLGRQVIGLEGYAIPDRDGILCLRLGRELVGPGSGNHREPVFCIRIRIRVGTSVGSWCFMLRQPFAEDQGILCLGLEFPIAFEHQGGRRGFCLGGQLILLAIFFDEHKRLIGPAVSGQAAAADGLDIQVGIDHAQSRLWFY